MTPKNSIESDRLVHSLALMLLSLYCLHILRNVSWLYYLFLASVLFFLCTAVAVRRNARIDYLQALLFLVWCYGTVLSISRSSLYGSEWNGLARFWATFPLLIVGSVLSNRSSKDALGVLCWFLFFASLSLAWQYFYGPVSWFAESSERAGGERYASLAGSLTSFGVLVGVGILIALVQYNGNLRVLLVVALLVGAVLSLQKAALANVVLAVVLACRLGGISRQLGWAAIVTFCTTALTFVFFIGSSVGEVDNQIYRQLVGVVLADPDLSGDVSFVDSVIDRVGKLPLEMVEFHGYRTLFFGAGVFGASGVLGYPELPMAHNGLFELIGIFGFLVGGLAGGALTILFFVALRFLARTKQSPKSELGLLYGVYAIWFLNYVFSGGGVFHPVCAAVLWVTTLRIRAIARV